MQKEQAIQAALTLVNDATIAMLGTNGDDGYPNFKAMLKMENEGLQRIWFSTNTSSRRVAQVMRNPRTCVYFVDMQQWMGLMLVGTIASRKPAVTDCPMPTLSAPSGGST